MVMMTMHGWFGEEWVMYVGVIRVALANEKRNALKREADSSASMKVLIAAAQAKQRARQFTTGKRCRCFVVGVVGACGELWWLRWRLLRMVTWMDGCRWVGIVGVFGAGEVNKQHGVQPFPFAEKRELGADVASSAGAGDRVGCARSTRGMEWRCGREGGVDGSGNRCGSDDCTGHFRGHAGDGFPDEGQHRTHNAAGDGLCEARAGGAGECGGEGDVSDGRG